MRVRRWRARWQAFGLVALMALGAAGALPLVAASADGGVHTPDADWLLRTVIDNMRGGAMEGVYTFVVERPGRVSEYVMEIASDGDRRGLIQVTAPPRDAGQAFLMDGDDLWVYNPRLGRSLRLPPSGRNNAFLGSDVNYNDIVGRDLERDYVASVHWRDGESDSADHASVDPAIEGADGHGFGAATTTFGDVLFLELTPRQGAPTPYGKVLIEVEAARMVPRWIDYYDQRGQVVKRLTLSEYLAVGERHVPLVMVVEDRVRQGHRTVVRLSDVEFDVLIPEACFTLQALERGCR